MEKLNPAYVRSAGPQRQCNELQRPAYTNVPEAPPGCLPMGSSDNRKLKRQLLGWTASTLAFRTESFGPVQLEMVTRFCIVVKNRYHWNVKAVHLYLLGSVILK